MFQAAQLGTESNPRGVSTLSDFVNFWAASCSLFESHKVVWEKVRPDNTEKLVAWLTATVGGLLNLFLVSVVLRRRGLVGGIETRLLTWALAQVPLLTWAEPKSPR